MSADQPNLGGSANASNGRRKPRRRGVIIGLIILVGIGLVGFGWLALESSNSLSINVSVYSVNFPTTLKIQNTGAGPIKILDIIINDRDDCPTIMAPTGKRDMRYFHQLWTADRFQLVWSKGIMVDAVGSAEPQLLNIGDSHDWRSDCSIVRATIKTDKGTASYWLK
jgi:hypothetical protein